MTGKADKETPQQQSKSDGKKADKWSYEKRVPKEFQERTYGNDPYPGFDEYLDQYENPALGYSEYRVPAADVPPSKDPKVTQPATKGALHEAIDQKFNESAHLNAEQVTITTNNTQVILEGRVATPAERHIASTLVTSISGVSHVINRLQVAEQ